ncbi:hypothetical protein PoB_004816800 [Plakobranchus ocellatus]|uniref:Uncharacterized protein n=1 Tax=Plakobranchus ocellatus TaxID=259542 RepID=A0AAV4BRA8_9GAST|nr:hypothetical protein PoB_004816800 [Plakobranchus ocellatus]
MPLNQKRSLRGTKSLPPKPIKIFVEEFDPKLPDRQLSKSSDFTTQDPKKTTLGLRDVIYENTAAEKKAEKPAQSAKQNESAEIPKTSSSVDTPKGNFQSSPSKSPQKKTVPPLPQLGQDYEDISTCSKISSTQNSPFSFKLKFGKGKISKRAAIQSAEVKAVDANVPETMFKGTSNDMDGPYRYHEHEKNVGSTSLRKRASPPTGVKIWSSKKKKSDNSNSNSNNSSNSNSSSSSSKNSDSNNTNSSSVGSEKGPNGIYDDVIINEDSSYGHVLTSSIKPKPKDQRSNRKQKTVKSSSGPARRESAVFLLSDSSESSSLSYDVFPGQTSQFTSPPSSMPTPNTVSSPSSRSTSVRTTSSSRKSLL